MTPADFQHWLLNPNRPPLVMGVLNVTPDSFSDGGKFASTDAAIAQARLMLQQGAHILDIGGESTRPGAQRIPDDEQIRRVVPVIQALCHETHIPVISIDTTLASVARAALDAGATLVNDISGGLDDPALLPLVAQRKSPVVLMHKQGTPATMQQNPNYRNVVQEVRDFLLQRAAAAQQAGIQRHQIILDPGIGFGKKLPHNLALMREIAGLVETGHPILFGTSRKSFIEKITGETEPSQRIFGTAASVAWGVAQGAAIVRVHDVDPMTKIVRMISAIMSGGVE